MEKTKEREEVVEEEKIITPPITKNKKFKKRFTIMGITIWRLLAYFILYSMVGFVIETLFGLITKGIIESRRSFLYGPFCAIYGIGAVIMIPLLQHFKKNNHTLFFGGFFIGSIVEYLISVIGEWIFHIRWWDYSEMAFNINGRICIAFSFFWGILAIYLMVYINPKIDKWIDKVKEKISIKCLKISTIILILFMLFDFLISGFALKMFFTRLIATYHLEVQAYDEYVLECAPFYQNETIKNFTLTHFSDERMLKTFPNIKLTAKEGNIIWISDILKDIQPYYFRVFTPKLRN